MSRYNIGRIIRSIEMKKLPIRIPFNSPLVGFTSNPNIVKLTQVVGKYGQVGAAIEKYGQVGASIKKLLAAIAELPAKQQAMVVNMSDKGWFPFEQCLMRFPKTDEDIDTFMIRRIDNFYEELKQSLLERNPSRSHILEVAFELFENKKYIACIPLVLTQIDGICHDFHDVFYFTKENGKKFPNIVQERMKEDDNNKEIYDILREIVDKANQNFISQRFSKLENIDNINILNRGAILHGHRDFLNYGDEPNAYKVFSLLLYVNWMIELFEENGN